MRCPYCGSADTQVKDSRPAEDNSCIRRRRVCPVCGGRFTTFERVQLRELVVVKKSGRRAPFDRDKLMRSLQIALRKRPVDPERVELMVNGVVRQLESSGDSEVESSRIGELVIEGLRSLDPVAFVRFASVYRDFREARDFNALVDELVGEAKDSRNRQPRAARAKKSRTQGRRAKAHERRRSRRGLYGAALALGRRNLGRAAPNPAVGALVVRGGVIVGRGFTGAGGRPHAETLALSSAGEAARGATLYVTLEPCSHHGETPPCVDAIIASGVARVVTAMDDPDPRVAGRGHALLRAAGLEVATHVLERDGAARSSRPFAAGDAGSPDGDAQTRADSGRLRRRRGS